MAVRVLTYVGLLYQDSDQGAEDSLTTDCSPTWLPVVLYNGPARWRASTEVRHFCTMRPVGLEPFARTLRYLLIDEGAYDDELLRARRKSRRDSFSIGELFSAGSSQRNSSTVLVPAAQGCRARKVLTALFAVWLDRKVIFTRFIVGASADSTKQLWETETMLADRVPVLGRRTSTGRAPAGAGEVASAHDEKALRSVTRFRAGSA